LKALAEACSGFTEVSVQAEVWDADSGYRAATKSDMEFLDAANPAAVLELIAEIKRLERKNANQSESIREYQDLVMGGDVSLGVLKADLRVTTGERDQLKAENEALRRGMKGDYDLDAWLQWSMRNESHD